MGILLSFAPFVVFVIFDRLLGSTPGLIAASVTSLALLGRDWLSPGRSPKVLEIGTAILFGGMAAYALLLRPDWSIIGVRLRVDLGLLVIVLVSMAIRQPFTAQYAREQVDRALWDTPRFMRMNYVITAAWAAAFALLVAADLVMLYMPEVPLRVGIWTTVIALVAAMKFTGWYPSRAQKESRPEVR
jgi:hypothetical protein